MMTEEIAETSRADVQALYQPPPGSHKGENGKLLMVVGSEKYHGSAVLCAKIASRLVDLVYFCSVAANNELLRQMKLGLAEFITVEREEVASASWRIGSRVDAVLIGPGLGVSAEAKKLMGQLLTGAKAIKSPIPQPRQFPNPSGFSVNPKGFSSAKEECKFVLDADALKLISPGQLGPHVLVTPHAGEFEALFGRRVPVALEERVALVRQMAERYRCTVVLKGPVDVIAGPAGEAPLPPPSPTSRDPRSVVSFSRGTFLNGRLGGGAVAIAGNNVLVKVNRTGNAGMTKGGTGDVLAGLIAALACKNELFLAGCAGAYLNGLAGDRLAKRVGWVYNASDLVEEIPPTYGEVKSMK